jgi:hypothetical protein
MSRSGTFDRAGPVSHLAPPGYPRRLIGDLSFSESGTAFRRS